MTIHVPNVEQAALLAGPLVAVSYTEVRILDGHGVAAKRNHSSAILYVDVIECRAIRLEG